MRALVAVIVIVVAIVVIVAVVHYFPAQKPALQPQPSAPTTAGPRAPVAVVTDYVGALRKKDYRAAYDELSHASRQAHPYEDFVKLNAKGMTEYDLASAKQEPGQGQVAVVDVQLREDVSEASFTLIQEGGQWKVVFIKGIPSFPYPE